MDLGLAGRTALVTGSWRGTGAGIARVLADEGATVLVHGFEAGSCAAVVEAIVASGGSAFEVVGDIRTDSGAEALKESVGRVVDHVDIVINNYGVAEGSDWVSSDAESWHSSYNTNVVTGIRVTNVFLEGMRAKHWGRIVFLSTVGATRPGERIPEYYAAKGALPSVAVSMSKYLANTGITVNCVSPGIIATAEMIDLFTERARRKGRSTEWPAVEQMVLESGMANPSGKIPSPDDVGRFVAFVVSESAWHLNGAHLRFDGGAADAVT